MISKRFVYIFIFILGLSPLLWFGFDPEIIFKTGDLRLPAGLDIWKQYLFVWNDRICTGVEALLDNCLVVFQGIPALLQRLGLSLAGTQRVIFVFWFMLMGFSIFYLMDKLVENKFKYVACITAASFYMFNLWQEHVWLGFKPPLITGLAIIPFIIGVYIKGSEGKLGIFRYSIVISIILALGGAIANNPSEMLGVLLPIMICMIYYFFRKENRSNSSSFKRNIGLICSTIFFSILLNSYWLLPQAYAIYRNIKLGVVPGLQNVCLDWLQGTSIHTSFFNVIRLQGDWVWYGGHGDPYRIYAQFYHSNIFMIILSWCIPLLVLSGIVFGKNKHKTFFTLLTIIGIILCMGVHKPFGYTYMWMVKHLPLFWTVRSPYFKFGTLICLSYSFFIGIACSRIYEYFYNRGSRMSKNIGMGTISILICIIIIYAFPVATGRMYTSQKDRKLLPPDRTKIPKYVLDTAKYFNSQNSFFRVFCMPVFNPQLYTWGFAAFEPVLHQFVNKPLLFKYDIQYILTAQVSPNMAEEMTNYIKEVLYSKKTIFISKLLKMLNVRYILQQNDIRYDFFGGIDSPVFLKKRLESQEGVFPCQKFNEWDVYKIKDKLPHIFLKSRATLVNGSLEVFTPLTNTTILDYPCVVLNDGHNTETVKILLEKNMISETIFYNAQEKDFSIKENNVNKDCIFYFSTFEMDNAPSKEKAEDYNNVKIAESKGFHDFKLWNDGWNWLKTNMEPNLVIENKTDTLISSNLYFEAYNYGGKKELCVYFNRKPFKAYNLEENEIKAIVIDNIEFMPGENIILFYTPSQHSYRDDIAINFGFKNFQLCNLEFNGSIYVPYGSIYDIKIYPASLMKAKKSKMIKFDDKMLNLHFSSGGGNYYFEKKRVKIGQGWHTFSVSQENYENYFIELGRTDIGELNLKNKLPGISYTKINPAKYRVDIENAQEPFMLIFCEAYHPLWTAYIDNKKVENHFSVNGYANGYLIDKKGKFTINLKFYPKRLAIFGRWISFIGLILAVIICFFRFPKG